MIVVTNQSAFAKSLAAVAERVVGREVARMERAADEIEAEAAATVGVETGALRDSGERLPTEEDGKRFISVVAFGGAAAPYAGVVHDAPWSASEGFLSDAARASRWPG